MRFGLFIRSYSSMVSTIDSISAFFLFRSFLYRTWEPDPCPDFIHPYENQFQTRVALVKPEIFSFMYFT